MNHERFLISVDLQAEKYQKIFLLKGGMGEKELHNALKHYRDSFKLKQIIYFKFHN